MKELENFCTIDHRTNPFNFQFNFSPLQLSTLVSTFNPFNFLPFNFQPSFQLSTFNPFNLQPLPVHKQKKPHRPIHGTGASSKTGCANPALRFCVGALFARNQHLTAIVQVAFYHVGMVEKVLLTGRLASRDVRSFRFVVRAAGALAALRMPPFRIWHDLSIL